MTVTCPPERLQWIRDVLRDDNKRISVKLVQSVVGLLEFLASVLPFLRAPLGWLQHRASAQVAERELCNDEFKLRFKSYFRYIDALVRDWSGSASIYASVITTSPDIVIFSDASGDIGFGAIEAKSTCYGYGTWTPTELIEATTQRLYLLLT